MELINRKCLKQTMIEKEIHKTNHLSEIWERWKVEFDPKMSKNPTARHYNATTWKSIQP